MVEQVVGLEFIVTGAADATAAIKRMANSQAQLTGSISKSLGVTQRVENEVRKLAKSYTDGSLNLNQYTKAVSQTANAYGVFIGNNKRARSDVAALSTALVAEAKAQKQSTQAKAAAAAAIKAEAQALKDYRQARRDATAANQRYDAEAKATAQATRATAQEEERLRLKYVQGHAAMETYSRELNDLAMARKKNIISAAQQRQAVAELNIALAKGTGAFAGAGAAAQIGGRRMNSFGMLTQQAGYQLGDFAVQVQGGTNPMVAFGQQATQMIGAFNLLPRATLMASVGIGVLRISVVALIASLGVIIPVLTAIGAYFMRANAAAKEAASGVDTLEDSIKSLDQSLRDYLLTKKAAQLGITKEELISGDALKEAERGLATATENLLKFQEARDAIANAPTFEGAAVNFLTDLFTDPEGELKAALDDAVRAQERLASLQQKQADERLANFDKERIELQSQLAMAQEIASFGKDSAQVAKLALDQRIAAFDRNIDQQVTANQLAVDQGIILKAVNAEIAKTEFATEEIDRNQDLIKSGAEVLNTVWSNLKAIVSDAADDAGRFADNLVLGQGYLDAAVRSGVSSGAIPPQALQDLPQTPAQKAMERILDQRRRGARRPDAPDTPSGGAAQINELQQEIDSLNKTAAQGVTPFEKYNTAIDHLNKLRSQGLSQAAYSIEIERLNDELGKSLPMVDDVADAFGNFLARGMTDFKSFADSIFKSFQNMLAQMIATAARNRILISLGATGSMAGTAASAAGGLAQGAGILGGAGAFASSIGTGLSVVGSGFAAGGIGGAATASMGAISGGIGMGGAAGLGTALGAAIPIIGAVALAVGLFRTKTKELDSGLNVTVGNMDALVETFKTVEKSRFFGLSKRTSTSGGAASSAVADPIVAAVQQIQQSVLAGAETLGVGAKVFEDFTYRLNFSLKGMTEEQKLQKLNEELSKMGDAFASLIPNVRSMAELTAILNERYSLETRLLQLQGDTQALRQRELATVNEYNRGILEQIFATEDAAAATSKLNSALSALSENDFATMLDFNRAQAAIRMGLPVANTPDSVSMPSNASPSSKPTGPGGTSSEVAKLRQDMKEMHKETMFAYSKLIKNSKDSRDTLRSFDIIGLPPERTA